MMIQTHARAFIHQTRRQPRTCEFPECSQTTREFKPYCSDHVDAHPYVKAILDRQTKDAASDDAG